MFAVWKKPKATKFSDNRQSVLSHTQQRQRRGNLEDGIEQRMEGVLGEDHLMLHSLCITFHITLTFRWPCIVIYSCNETK